MTDTIRSRVSPALRWVDIYTANTRGCPYGRRSIDTRRATDVKPFDCGWQSPGLLCANVLSHGHSTPSKVNHSCSSAGPGRNGANRQLCNHSYSRGQQLSPKTGLAAVARSIELRNRFEVGNHDFAALEIRQNPNSPNLYFFYDASRGTLIKQFILRTGARTLTLCTVTLVHDGTKLSPRFRFLKARRGLAPASSEDSDNSPTETNLADIKAAVDLSDAHKNVWELLNYLQAHPDLDTGPLPLRAMDADTEELAEFLKNIDDKKSVLTAVSSVYAGELTQADIDLIANRKGQLQRFKSMLSNNQFFEAQKAALNKSRDEDVWQAFFEANPWIFGYGLSLVSSEPIADKKLEQITTGASLLDGAGKRADAVMTLRGGVNGLLFCEIKKHTTQLLHDSPYRPPDVYRPTVELVGAVAQVQKTTDKFVRGAHLYLREVLEKDGTRTGFEISTIRPKQVVVMGRSVEFLDNGLLNPEKVSSFELYRRSILDVDILTFDELYERARFIIGDT